VFTGLIIHPNELFCENKFLTMMIHYESLRAFDPKKVGSIFAHLVTISISNLDYDPPIDNFDVTPLPYNSLKKEAWLLLDIGNHVLSYYFHQSSYNNKHAYIWTFVDTSAMILAK
jgi:hypothetical protein